jgi:hypothetical protein
MARRKTTYKTACPHPQSHIRFKRQNGSACTNHSPSQLLHTSEHSCPVTEMAHWDCSMLQGGNEKYINLGMHGRHPQGIALCEVSTTSACTLREWCCQAAAAQSLEFSSPHPSVNTAPVIDDNFELCEECALCACTGRSLHCEFILSGVA